MSLQFPENTICEGCSHYRESRPHITIGMTIQKITCETRGSGTDVQTSCVNFKQIGALSKAA